MGRNFIAVQTITAQRERNQCAPRDATAITLAMKVWEWREDAALEFK
jgi:hypothetical protein